LSQEKVDGAFYELGKLPNARLIIGYSESRAKKDQYNREKGVSRLKKACKSGQITKDHINPSCNLSGYKKL
jgi:hypothetical protein